MNIAYCVLCHKYTNVIEECIRIISQDNDIYIHIDSKSDINEFDSLRKYNIKFIENRVDVKWGEFSQVKAMLMLLSEVYEKEYDYISIISGDDLPIKSDKYIKNFFFENNGMEFIGIQKNYDKQELINRIKYKYPVYYFKKNKSLLDRIAIKLNKKIFRLKVNENFKNIPVLYKGAQWFTITQKFNDYIINYIRSNENYLKAFEHSLCSDEIFFQTLIMHSPFKDKIYRYDDSNNSIEMSLRYIDWNTGPDYPKLLDETDLDRLRHMEAHFARKFNSEINILEYRKMYNCTCTPPVNPDKLK